MSEAHGPQTPVAQQTHAEKYQQPNEGFVGSQRRVALALSDDDHHRAALEEIFLDQRFMAAGRVQAAMGSTKRVTAYNCFVGGVMQDTFVDGEGSIMHRALQAAQTMRSGGGLGTNFGTLRPKGWLVKSLMSTSSGPVPFMHIQNAVGRATSSAGNRRGAQMGAMPVWHPDIEEFIDAKKPPAAAQPIMDMMDHWKGVAANLREMKKLSGDGDLDAEIAKAETEFWKWFLALQTTLQLTGFNVSVGATDEFMSCLGVKDTFSLRWGGTHCREINPDQLWEKIMLSTWDWAEPGVLFLDTINRENNLWYCEEIWVTNPCFTGDTKVWTDQGHRSFRELAEAGEDVKVLTQVDSGQLVYRTMRQPRITQRKQPLVRVSFMFGSSVRTVRCTPEHRFFTGSGQAVAAKDLESRHLIKATYNRENFTAEVVGVEFLQEREDVYCGTVDETSKFFVALSESDGVLVSNCGEQPLPAHAACLLGSFNLTKYIKRRPDGTLFFDFEQLLADIPHVVRAMDNVVDRALYPLPEQEQEARAKRRMGLGVTGVANALEALGLPYGSAEFIEALGNVLRTISHGCYHASIQLAKEKGSFPMLDVEKFLQSGHNKRVLTPEHVDGIRRHGIRNSHLTSIAPCGTISICADNISSSLEPVFSYLQKRDINFMGGKQTVDLLDYGVANFGVYGRKADAVTAKQHLAVLAEAQKWVDSAVSKTCNVSGSMPWAEFKDLYTSAWRMGCKGITTFNKDGKRAGILRDMDENTTCTFDAVTGVKSCE